MPLFMQTLFMRRLSMREVAYGLRLIRRNPGFAAVTVITLALGIGANTAIFSILDALLLRNLPGALKTCTALQLGRELSVQNDPG